METLPTQTAIEAFLRGFSTTRSFTKPYVIRKAAEGVWMLADPPGAKLPRRTPEFVTRDMPPAAVVDAVRREAVDRYALCVLTDDAEDLARTVSEYKALGQRYMGKEPLFVLDLAERASFGGVPVERITTPEAAAGLATAARSRQILPAHLGEADAVCRVYAAYVEDRPIGWTRSIRTHDDCAWVAGLFVAKEHRRMGVGRSLLSAMLDDDARFGVRWSVLLASSAGAMLYPHLGYREQGLLAIFTPAKAGPAD